MTKSQDDAYDEVVRQLFRDKQIEKRALLAKVVPGIEKKERDKAFAIVRAAIIKKTQKPPNDWVTAAEASVYIGDGGAPRTLSQANSGRQLSGKTGVVKRSSRLPGLQGRGSGRRVRYRLTDLDKWQKDLAAAKRGTAAAASSSLDRLRVLDEGIEITTVEELLNQLPWLVKDGKLISPLLITRLTQKQISAFFNEGAQVAWFSLHEAMTRWVWISSADRWPWSEGYRLVLEGEQQKSKRYDDATAKEQARIAYERLGKHLEPHFERGTRPRL